MPTNLPRTDAALRRLLGGAPTPRRVEVRTPVPEPTQSFEQWASPALFGAIDYTSDAARGVSDYVGRFGEDLGDTADAIGGVVANSGVGRDAMWLGSGAIDAYRRAADEEAMSLLGPVPVSGQPSFPDRRRANSDPVLLSAGSPPARSVSGSTSFAPQRVEAPVLVRAGTAEPVPSVRSAPPQQTTLGAEAYRGVGSVLRDAGTAVGGAYRQVADEEAAALLAPVPVSDLSSTEFPDRRRANIDSVLLSAGVSPQLAVSGPSPSGGLRAGTPVVLRAGTAEPMPTVRAAPPPQMTLGQAAVEGARSLRPSLGGTRGDSYRSMMDWRDSAIDALTDAGLGLRSAASGVGDYFRDKWVGGFEYVPSPDVEPGEGAYRGVKDTPIDADLGLRGFARDVADAGRNMRDALFSSEESRPSDETPKAPATDPDDRAAIRSRRMLGADAMETAPIIRETRVAPSEQPQTLEQQEKLFATKGAASLPEAERNAPVEGRDYTRGEMRQALLIAGLNTIIAAGEGKSALTALSMGGLAGVKSASGSRSARLKSADSKAYQDALLDFKDRSLRLEKAAIDQRERASKRTYGAAKAKAGNDRFPNLPSSAKIAEWMNRYATPEEIALYNDMEIRAKALEAGAQAAQNAATFNRPAIGIQKAAQEAMLGFLRAYAGAKGEMRGAPAAGAPVLSEAERRVNEQQAALEAAGGRTLDLGRSNMFFGM